MKTVREVEATRVWATPRHPGDAVRIVPLVRGNELGDIRIQDYMGAMKLDVGSYRVGMFLPGEIECSPGDTPKTWPEKSAYKATVADANTLFEIYYYEALGNGWRLYDKNVDGDR